MITLYVHPERYEHALESPVVKDRAMQEPVRVVQSYWMPINEEVNGDIVPCLGWWAPAQPLVLTIPKQELLQGEA